MRNYLMLAAISLLLAGCTTSPHTIKTTQLPKNVLSAVDFIVQGIFPIEPAKGVKESLGEPQAKQGTNGEVWVYSDYGLKVEFDDNTFARRIEITGEGIGPMSRGLKVGDGIDKVRELYGTPASEDPITYKSESSLHFTMVVHNQGGRVRRILLERN